MEEFWFVFAGWREFFVRFKWLTCVGYGGYVLILLVRKIIESAFFLLFTVVAAREIEDNSISDLYTVFSDFVSTSVFANVICIYLLF